MLICQHSTGGWEDILWWNETESEAFQALKKSLMSAPALAFPNLSKPIQFYVAEVWGITKGVLIQALRPWKRPVAYLSKKLDYVAAEWSGCLKAVSAMAIFTKETSKVTLDQDLQIVAPRSVEALLKSPSERWLSSARITQYQVLLLYPPRIKFLKTALNLTTLLPDSWLPIHDCKEVL